MGAGNAADSFSYQSGRMFTTYDRDNDFAGGNCAMYSLGGFWYKQCGACVLNSAYSSLLGFKWNGLPGGRTLMVSRMWLQCK